MTLNAITHAVCALKLVPLHLNHPTIVSRSTLIGATSEALSMLDGLPPVTAELAEVFRAVDSVLLEVKSPMSPHAQPRAPIWRSGCRHRWAALRGCNRQIERGSRGADSPSVGAPKEGRGEDAA